jgi:hypothetical protein
MEKCSRIYRKKAGYLLAKIEDLDKTIIMLRPLPSLPLRERKAIEYIK